MATRWQQQCLSVTALDLTSADGVDRSNLRHHEMISFALWVSLCVKPPDVLHSCLLSHMLTHTRTHLRAHIEYKQLNMQDKLHISRHYCIVLILEHYSQSVYES